ncbi:MarR family winged helix-turn-helix transcriptional regulator [Umezawaea beigongshangensis]|uniref:MarR family winged helix-turn-helix transcriptional regulator n=1 Tax=Umezawaea beigongshangensis TaxID=2780383 RepID=UPI0018F16ECC|nr:MarR family transcriptional regulator [Umezawaea beigongshangensis]
MTKPEKTAADDDAGTAALAERIGTAIVRLNKMHACIAQQMSRTGMDKASFVLLATLATLGPSRSSTLAEAVFSDPSTVSRQVAALVKDGLVERRADPDDGRASVLAVTDDGTRLLAERRRWRNEGMVRLLAHWSAEDLEVFTEHFERFVHDFEGAVPVFIAERGAGPRSGGEK